MVPSVRSSLATFTLAGALDVFSAALACFADGFPSDEKFQTPSRLRSKAISGCSIVNWVTLSCLLKMRGISSTPTWSDFAWINGALPNLGSSAMENWSASTLPDRMLRLRLPTFTGRPSAELRFDSICGRKLLTFTRNGIAMAATINTATTMPTTLRTVFTAVPPTTGFDGERGGSGIDDSLSNLSTCGDGARVGKNRPGFA